MTTTDRTLLKMEEDLAAIQKIKNGFSDFQKCEYETRGSKRRALNTRLVSLKKELAGIAPQSIVLHKHRRRELIIVSCFLIFVAILIWIKVTSEIMGNLSILAALLYYGWQDLTVRFVELELRLLRSNLEQNIETINMSLQEINLGFIPYFDEYESLYEKSRHGGNYKLTDLDKITMTKAEIEYEKHILSGMGIDVLWLYRL